MSENVKLSPTLGDWGDNFENVKLSTQSPTQVNLSTQRRCGAYESVLSVLLTRKASDSHLQPCSLMELPVRLHARKEKKKKSQCEENVKLSPTLGDSVETTLLARKVQN